MLPNPAWPLRLKPLTLAEFKAWLSRCVIIIPGPHVSVYKKWRTKSYQCSHNYVTHDAMHVRTTLYKKNGVLKVISVAFSSVFAYQVKEATEFLLNLLEDYLLQPFFFGWCAELWSGGCRTCRTCSYGPVIDNIAYTRDWKLIT